MTNKYYTYDIYLPKHLHLRKSIIINKIISTLNDKRSWTKYGFKFHYTPNQKTNFLITIATNSSIQRICNFDGLSCADLSDNIIYLNLENWKGGCRKSKLSLQDYRTYMILHEVGHIIGKKHIKIKNCKPLTKCPVMIQQTLGIYNLLPNCWPTKYDNFI